MNQGLEWSVQLFNGHLFLRFLVNSRARYTQTHNKRQQLVEGFLKDSKGLKDCLSEGCPGEKEGQTVVREKVGVSRRLFFFQEPG